ncbi:5' nucleotidase, NT5C type [Bacillus dakarensis]|uniref:5' nucleotidase, NT5C type n=1 Tax=Robertmurraya dakarensis TaxID=1926278 RepID=UPI000981F207|nr:hypothetical protein [Bacillus dakarensis]
MKKKFGIDIDGTVTHPATIIPYMNKSFNVNLTLDDIKDYNLSLFLDVSEEDFSKWWLEHEALIYSESPLAEGAKEVLVQWGKEHELYFISARSIHLVKETTDWFKLHGIPYQHIELLGKHNKVNQVKKYNLEIFLEDKHDNAVMIHEECKIPVILFNTPYNQDPVPDGVIRVNNWAEARSWIEHWLKT